MQGFYLPGVAPRAFKDGEAVQMKVQTLVSTETPLQVQRSIPAAPPPTARAARARLRCGVCWRGAAAPYPLPQPLRRHLGCCRPRQISRTRDCLRPRACLEWCARRVARAPVRCCRRHALVSCVGLLCWSLVLVSCVGRVFPRA